MNLEEEAKKVHINTNEVTDIASKCNELLKLQKQVATAEDALKKLKEQERKISEEEIPKFIEFAANNYSSRFLDKRESAVSSAGVDDASLKQILESQDADLYQEELEIGV